MIPKMKKVNLSTQLIETITGLIESGEWAPGIKLPNEIELAASFNVSRNIMRESLKILENFGILESRAGIGTTISQTAMSSIYNMRFFNQLKNDSSIELIMETRLTIEPALAAYAAKRISDEECEQLRRKFSAPTDGNFTRRDDFDFHIFVSKCSRSTIMENLLFTMLSQLRNSEYTQFDVHADSQAVASSYRSHKGIAEAIVSHDAEAARALMAAHLKTRMEVISSSYSVEVHRKIK